MARKLKEEYEKWRLSINLEKTKYVCVGEGKKFKIWRRGRNKTMYRMYLLRYVQKYTSREIIQQKLYTN
jgi:hypothetical protein